MFKLHTTCNACGKGAEASNGCLHCKAIVAFEEIATYATDAIDFLQDENATDAQHSVELIANECTGKLQRLLQRMDEHPIGEQSTCSYHGKPARRAGLGCPDCYNE